MNLSTISIDTQRKDVFLCASFSILDEFFQDDPVILKFKSSVEFVTGGFLLKLCYFLEICQESFVLDNPPLVVQKVPRPVNLHATGSSFFFKIRRRKMLSRRIAAT